MNLLFSEGKSATDRDIELQTRLIVAAEERTRRAIEYLGEDVSTGIQHLTTVVGWGLWEISEKLDEQSELLERAVVALESPRTTLANEARRMGIERFRHGWLEESIEEFQRCLQANSTDFLAHLFIAIVALINDRGTTALEHAQKAAKYAAPYSTGWASFAWALSAKVHFTDGDYELAHKAARQAVQLDETSAIAHYEEARASVALNDSRSALRALGIAIRLEPLYYDLAGDDPVFYALRKDVEELQQHLLSYAKVEADGVLEQSRQIRAVGQDAERKIGMQLVPLQVHAAELGKARQRIEKAYYTDVILGRMMLLEANKAVQEKLVNSISLKIRDLESHSNAVTFEQAQPLISIVTGLALFVGFLKGCTEFTSQDLSPILLTPLKFVLLAGVLCFVVILSINYARQTESQRKVQALQALRSQLES